MSRYANEPKVWMPDRNGQMVEAVVRPVRVYNNQQYITYTAKSTDTIWSLAHRFYKDPTEYWVLADMNPRITFPDDLAFGMTVNVPIGT